MLTKHTYNIPGEHVEIKDAYEIKFTAKRIEITKQNKKQISS